MIKSNINNWIRCNDESGSLVHWRNGNINCRVVRDVTRKCTWSAPRKLQVRLKVLPRNIFSWRTVFSLVSTGWVGRFIPLYTSLRVGGSI